MCQKLTQKRSFFHLHFDPNPDLQSDISAVFGPSGHMLPPDLGANRQLDLKRRALPSVDSTQMRPPCISTICLAMASPRAGPALGLRVRAVNLMELLENASLVLFGNAWSWIGHTDVEVTVGQFHRLRP